MDEIIQAATTILRDLHIRYVVIGGIASSLRGKPRTTADMDVVVGIEKSKAAKLVDRLREAQFQIPQRATQQLQRGEPVKFRKHGSPWALDIRVATVSLDKQAIQRAKAANLLGRRIEVATAEDIILYKLLRFNALDQADIKSILLRSGRTLDLAYLRRSVSRLAAEMGKPEASKHLKVLLGG